MTYKTSLSINEREIITRLWPRLEELQVEDFLTLTDSPWAIRSLKSTLYNHFFIEGIQGEFLLKHIAPTKLIIKRRRSSTIEPPKIETSAPPTPLSSKLEEELFTSGLLDKSNQQEALALLEEMNLSPQDSILLFQEWQRISGTRP